MNNTNRRHRILNDFFDSTSIHGLYQIRHATFAMKIVWAIFFLSMLSFSLFFCSKSVILYLRRDIHTKLKYQTTNEIKFPAITFCNQFSLKAEAGSNLLILMIYETLLAKRAEDISSMIDKVRQF